MGNRPKKLHIKFGKVIIISSLPWADDFEIFVFERKSKGERERERENMREREKCIDRYREKGKDRDTTWEEKGKKKRDKEIKATFQVKCDLWYI